MSEALFERLRDGIDARFAALPPNGQEARLDELLPVAQDDALLSEQFAACDRIIASDPGSWTGWYLRGVLRYRTEHDGEASWHDGNGHALAAALDDFDRAIQRGAEFYNLRLHRLWCHEALYVPVETLDDSTRLLDIEPRGWIHFSRGKAHFGLGENAESLVEFERAEALEFLSPRMHETRARIWQQDDQTDRAIESLERAMEDDPDEPWTPDELHHRAHLWDSLGRQDRANADFRLGFERNPQASFVGCWSRLLAEMDETDEVRASLEIIDRATNGEEDAMSERTLIYPLVLGHFREAPLDSLSITERVFPHRAVADVQKALDSLDQAGFRIDRFHAAQQNNHPVDDFTTVYSRERRNAIVAAPPQHLEVDIGEDEPVRVLKFGLWLLTRGEERLCVLIHGSYEGLKVIVAVQSHAPGVSATHAFYKHIEEAIARSVCYRGKVLSLENRESYNGQALGITVHKIRKVERDEVILPRKTLDLLDRNVIDFVRQRPRLAKLGLAVKKGLLFYGPPGTGKTHTIHYLSDSIPGHTTFLISAEQVCNLSEYMTLARLLQPSIVVLEDVDLIARDRAEMRSPGEETLLNKLLNEMDGLKADSEILFVLTTNRPESLEAALASRPGRVDQAIEYPLPDAEGRTKLVRLYSQGVPLAAGALDRAVDRTRNVSASFIKELMRRAIQTSLMRSGDDLEISTADVDGAVDEMMVAGGSLNRKLLGAHDSSIGFATASAPPVDMTASAAN